MSTIFSSSAILSDRFYQPAAGFLLVIVLVGFTPTFDLRDAFGAAPYPFYVWLHGAILTGWFAIF